MSSVPSPSNSTFSLICEDHVTVVWRAIQALTQGSAWIYIEDVAVFLRTRQEESRTAPTKEARAYLKPLDVNNMQGWDDTSIVHSLNVACRRGVVLKRRMHDGYYFKSVQYNQQRPWRVIDSDCPVREEWNTLYKSLKESPDEVK